MQYLYTIEDAQAVTGSDDKMPEQADQHDWAEFYRRVQNAPPRETLLKALAYFDSAPVSATARFAIDLGCGAGQDTFELLRRGWRVLAIDQESQSIQRVRAGAAAIPTGELLTRESTFEQLTELPQADLINASFCLPFIAPADFPRFWTLICESLSIWGRVAGHLFGERDTWVGNPRMNFHTITEIERLLAPYVTEFFEEREQNGEDAFSRAKHWHVYSFVVRRP